MSTLWLRDLTKPKLFGTHLINFLLIFSLMLSLCIYDLFCLLSSMVIFAVPLLWPKIPSWPGFVYAIPYLLPVAHIGMTGEDTFRKTYCPIGGYR